MSSVSKKLAFFFACVLVLGLCLPLAGCFYNEEEAEAEAAAAATESGDGSAEVSESNTEGGAGDKDAAQELVGQSLTRDEIEAAVGTPSKFVMSSAGCERGVYGGYFYYDGFSIFSRSYDKGGTFTVVSISE